MRTIWRSLRTFVRDESAPTTVEYGLLVAAGFLTLIAAKGAFRNEVRGLVATVYECLRQL